VVQREVAASPVGEVAVPTTVSELPVLSSFSAPRRQEGAAAAAVVQREAALPVKQDVPAPKQELPVAPAVTIVQREVEVTTPAPAPAPAPVVQRVESAAPADPAPAAAQGAAAGGSGGRGGDDLDELARKLYDRIRWRLRGELRLDMERAGLGAGVRR